MRWPYLVCALAVALAAAGCGDPHGPGRPAAAPGPCSAAARGTIAGVAGTQPSLVAATGFVAPSGAAGCRFAAAPPAGARVEATIDSAPQAEQRFERAVVEYGQTILSHQGSAAYPQNIDRLGVGADWFPADHRLLATDGARLVDVIVTWPGAPAGAARRLAESLARGYVAPPG